MRAELNSLQQQAMMNPTGIIPPMGNSPDHIQALEKDLALLKAELEVSICNGCYYGFRKHFIYVF